MDIVVGSAAAPAALVRRLAGRAEASAWARWTLVLGEDAPEGGFARALAWRLLTRGALVPLDPELEGELRVRFAVRAARAAGVLHRLQVAAVAAEPSGLPSRIDSDLARVGFSSGEAAWLAEVARRDLARLLGDVGRLYPEESAAEGEALFVSWTSAAKPGWRLAWVCDGAAEGAVEFVPRASAPPFRRDDEALVSLARRLFAVEALRPGQAQATAALLSGRDVSVFLPTGGGKSLVFQLAALLSPGTTLVVAPLRALLRDQARRLAEAGVTRIGFLSSDDPEATRRSLRELAAGRLILALAAPERLDSAAFRDALRAAAETDGVPFVVVDEAHCAARRGHDWRPAYRVLGARLREWSSSSGRVPALAVLSGSAVPGAFAEAERTLGLSDPVRVAEGAPRENLSFHVRRGETPDHLARLRELLTCGLPGGRFGPGIIFCPRVEGPLGAVDIAEELIWSEGVDIAVYAGRPPRGVEDERWRRDKGRAADEFLSGRRGLLCATRAFGLGVDRADVRFTAHLGLPASLEEFYQQAGRAGRDGKSAECWVLLQVLCARRALRWATASLERLRAEIDALALRERDDISRAYAFHLAIFPGEAAELKDVEIVLSSIGDLSQPGDFFAELPGQDPDALTRALVRLEEAGVVGLTGRGRGGWHARRAGGSSIAGALSAVAERIARDYRAVEPARRASLAELVELALREDAGAALAERLSACAPARRASPIRA